LPKRIFRICKSLITNLSFRKYRQYDLLNNECRIEIQLHSIVDVYSKIRLGFVDKNRFLVGVDGVVCWRRRPTYFAEKIMPQLFNTALRTLLVKKNCVGAAFFC
jgi:hypothetical protein